MLRLFRFFTQYKLIRYLISGGTAATLHLTIVFILTEFTALWYLYATSIAFVIALGVSFSLQKFWTFGSKTLHNMHKQGSEAICKH